MEAFDMIDTLTKSAIIYQDARAMGFTPAGMSEEQMQEISTVFHLPK
jgi:rhamnulose-1-phosphate aldolase